MHTLATCFRGARRRCRALFLVALGLASSQAGAAALDWQVDITPGGELFPVLDLSQAARAGSDSAGGGSGLVTVRVKSATPRKLHLRIETQGLRAPAIVDAEIARAGTIDLRPRLDWDRAWLESLHAPRAQTMRVWLEADGNPAQEREVAVRLHPLDDALYYVREGKDRVDLGWVFAAYVDPHDPVVDAVLALARDADNDIGARTETRAERIDQARAIWSALGSHGLKYASGDPALSRGPSIYSQRVRLLSDSWEQRRANCIDSSVLIASVLERLGIRAFIVLVPGHAFVGFYTGAGKSDAEFLETTLLGSGSSARGGDAGFEAALAAGRSRWNRVASRLDRRHRPDYAVIDIETARAYGIIPLAAAGAAGDRPEGASASAVSPIPPTR